MVPMSTLTISDQLGEWLAEALINADGIADEAMAWVRSADHTV